MESDQISEECLWCNMVLIPGVHPTTIKISTLTLSIICNSCMTDNVFHNIFSSFGHSVSGSLNKNSACVDKLCISKDLESSEIKVEHKEKQFKKIQNYFSPLKKLKQEHDDKVPKSETNINLGCEILTSKDRDIKQKTSQDVKLVTEEERSPSIKTKAEVIKSSSINKNINRSSTSILNVKELERSVFSLSPEFRKVRSETNTNSDSKISCESNIVTKLSDTTVTLSPVRNFKIMYSNDCEAQSSAKDSDFAKSKITKTDDTLTKNESKTHSSLSSDINKKSVDDSSDGKSCSSKESSITIIKDFWPVSINNSNSNLSSESVVKASKTITSAKSSSSLRTFRTKDKNFRYLKPSDKIKSEKNLSSLASPNIKSIENSSQKGAPEDLKSSFSKSTVPIEVKDTPQSAPPIHPFMNIISSSDKICKGCKIMTKDQSLWNMSKIYCPCCKDVPTFCNKKHFDYFHSQIHHWSTIPTEDGILRPVRKCRICSKNNYTRFYCPACPGKYGYCSIEHYTVNHEEEKPQLQSDLSHDSKKSATGDNQEEAKSNSANVSLKSPQIPNFQNLKEKIIPQTLSLSSFKFPTTSRCIYIKLAALGSTTIDMKESLKSVRLNGSSLNEKKQSSSKP